VPVLVHQFLGFGEDAFDAKAVSAARPQLEYLEYAIEALDMSAGFLEMRCERRAQLVVADRGDQLRQRPDDLMLGVIDISKLVFE
jgi:hypothetical protein